ncbi:hypothetical protein DUNSADRAFT_11989 [Dunaliella salina]|uniref:Uncharacterized protein n=1 Tax=Dunaliella salina TaxID=3046 RepID=A0ABQ7GC82_DUNSA|nr:hypothetical protein DUNSADRAFT_11989 [Dunaliella salina]|eukprot:KAF5832205.1 hypothetical protein DUNSADRAFT_11989 [Dunaliella salina]
MNSRTETDTSAHEGESALFGAFGLDWMPATAISPGNSGTNELLSSEDGDTVMPDQSVRPTAGLEMPKAEEFFPPPSPNPLSGVIHPGALLLEEERFCANTQALQASQRENEDLRRQLAAWTNRYGAVRREVDAVRTTAGYELAQRDQRIQELEHALQSPHNQNASPSWEDGQASLRAALGSEDFTLTLDTLKFLVHQPDEAQRVCEALGKIPGRERDVLLHHMQHFYGGYSSDAWATWYGYLWRILRWIGAYAAGPGPELPVEAAADQIAALGARRVNNRVISFEDWNMQTRTAINRNKVSTTANVRLQGLERFLVAWVRSGQSVNVGNREVDRMEQLVQGCSVQVYLM